MVKINPLSVKVKLAGNPSAEPSYGIKVRLKSGEEIQVADPKSTRAMVALMDMQAVKGGAASHWGGPSAFAEILSATYGYAFFKGAKENKNWYDQFHIINDAGHCENGIYALKANYGFADLSLNDLKGFRSVSSPLTGHGESHLFPEGVYLSNGPLGSSLPQAQGLAYADKLAGKSRITVTAISDGASMEGEAKEAMAAIPGLAAMGQLNPFVMIVSDNNTKLSGRIDEQTFSMEPSFQSLEALGWKRIKLEKGHDLQACMETLEEALEAVINDPSKPVVIHVKTIKGYGVKATADSSSGGHGFPLKKSSELRPFLEEIYAGESLPGEFSDWCKELEVAEAAEVKSSGGVHTEKVQVGVTKALTRAKENGFPVYSISSDLPGSTGTGGFQKNCPDNAKDIGVAESNMVSMAAGMSKEGFIPIVDTFSQFGVTKGALPLIMANLSQAPVIAIFSHAGFQDAADGASHQALSYFAMTASIPHTDVFCLSTSEEAEALVTQAIEKFAKDREQGKIPRTTIFFLGRENFVPQVKEGLQYKLGQAQVVAESSMAPEKSICIAAAGPLLHQALIAANELNKDGIGCFVVNPSSINRPDTQTFREVLQKCEGRLITAEDHQVVGGMGAMLVHGLTQQGVSVKLRSLGVCDQFGQSAYKALELYQKHQLDSGAMIKVAKSLI